MITAVLFAVLLTGCGGTTLTKASYLDHITETRAEVGDGLLRFASLSRSPRPNDLSWLNRVGDELDIWQAAYERDEQLSPLHELSALHSEHIRIFGLVNAAANDNRNGIANLDDGRVDRAAATLDQAAALNDEITALIREAPR